MQEKKKCANEHGRSEEEKEGNVAPFILKGGMRWGITAFGEEITKEEEVACKDENLEEPHPN